MEKLICMDKYPEHKWNTDVVGGMRFVGGDVVDDGYEYVYCERCLEVLDESTEEDDEIPF